MLISSVSYGKVSPWARALNNVYNGEAVAVKALHSYTQSGANDSNHYFFLRRAMHLAVDRKLEVFAQMRYQQ